MTKPIVCIGILTYERPSLLNITIKSLYKNIIASDIKFRTICYDSGSCYESRHMSKAVCSKFGISFIESKSFLPKASNQEEREQRIMDGVSNVFKLILNTDAQYFLFLEDDWECIGSLDLEELIDIYEEEKNIGQIRLRKCDYDSSLTGCSKINFVTKEEIIWKSILNKKNFLRGNLHWTNNPSFFGRATISKFHMEARSELDAMKSFHYHFKENLQLTPGKFIHIGPNRRRVDLEELGFFRKS